MKKVVEALSEICRNKPVFIITEEKPVRVVEALVVNKDKQELDTVLKIIESVLECYPEEKLFFKKADLDDGDIGLVFTKTPLPDSNLKAFLKGVAFGLPISP